MTDAQRQKTARSRVSSSLLTVNSQIRREAMETITERETIKTITTHFIDGAFRLRQNSVGRGDWAVLASFPNTSSDESTTNSGAIGDVIASARLTERKRIAQELHDTLLQGCFGVSMQLHATV